MAIFFKINLLYVMGQIVTTEVNAISRILHMQVPLQLPALRNTAVHRRVKSEHVCLSHHWEPRTCTQSEPIAGRTLSIQISHV